MNLAGHDIGVCSWSLAPKDTADLIQMLQQLNLSHMQLAIAPLIALSQSARQEQVDQVRGAGITITAGMISFAGEDYSTISRIRQTGGYVPDDLWPERCEQTAMASAICKAAGIKLLSTHVGFIPPSSGEKYTTMVERVRQIAGSCEQDGVTLLMETGQEHASELLQFLNDVRSKNACVNFDPANMVLYGAGDPVEAIGILGRHINHVHVKDAKESDQPGTIWGTEAPFGTGDVPALEFLTALREGGYKGPLVIEREAGANRLKDVQQAIQALRASLTA
jgi:sugar phosphate isomerase/epimerase